MPAKGITVSQGARAEFVPTDVTPRDQVARLIEATLKRFGDIHVLVNNAGVHDSAPFWEESEALWDRMYRVNVLGAVLPSQSVVRHMKERGGGAIVYVASKAGVVGEPGHAAYSASKGAVIALTRAMAVELAPCAIRVNAVCPGPVMTHMLLAAVPTVGIYLFDKVEVLDFAGPFEVFSTASRVRIHQQPDAALMNSKPVNRVHPAEQVLC